MRIALTQGIAGVACIGLVTGCDIGGDTPRSARVIRRDSAGIAIVETRAETAPLAAEAWIDSAPLVRVGRVAGDPRYELTRVVGLTHAPAGNIIVADAGAVRLRFYDERGSFIKEVGGTGEGPGESRRYLEVVRCGDSLVLTRDRDRRATWWTVSGELVGPARFVLPPGKDPRGGSWAGGGNSAPLYHACSPDGRILMTSWGDPTREPKPIPRQSLMYHAWSGLWLVDTAGTVHLEIPDTIIATRILGTGGSGPHMFGRNIGMALSSSDIFLSFGDRLEVSVYSHDGAHRSIWRATAEDLALTEEMIQRYMTGSLPPADSAERAYYSQRLEMPATYPAFDALRRTPSGRIWARRYRLPWETDVRWGLFNPDGEFKGYFRFPAGLEVFEIGDDYVLGVVMDELDVPFVHMYRIRPPAN